MSFVAVSISFSKANRSFANSPILDILWNEHPGDKRFFLAYQILFHSRLTAHCDYGFPATADSTNLQFHGPSCGGQRGSPKRHQMELDHIHFHNEPHPRRSFLDSRTTRR